MMSLPVTCAWPSLFGLSGHSPCFALGFSVSFTSASRGQGQGADDGTTFTNAQVSGQSVQSSKTAGFSVSVPITGANAGVSVSAGKTNINSNYNSVGEQSAIRAGDGGFQVNVAGNTTLTGGQITSSDKAVQEGRNTFSTAGQTAAEAINSGALTLTDLNNSASFDASGVNIGVGVSRGEAKDKQGNTLRNPDGSAQTKTAPNNSAGFGSSDGAASSTTVAAISGLAGNTAARTGDAETGIKPIFNKDEVKQEINAQVAITQEAGKRIPKAIGDQMGQKSKELETQAQEAERAGDTNKAQALRTEAQRYDEGGVYRIAAHTALGALTGGADGALGAAASSAAAPTLDTIQSQLQSALQNAGMSVEASQQVASLSTGALAATLGATAGGTAGAGAAFNADMNNRQLHPTEAKLIKDNARRYADKRGISVAQAEAELTQQSLRNMDSAHDKRLGDDNALAQAFLKELGQGQAAVDPLTGQRFELFTANEATRNNHAMFGQYAKLSPQTQSVLDRAYNQAFKPTGAQTITGLNGTNAGALTSSDLALKDAAQDLRHMRQEPQVVQWAVLGQLRQERAQNLQTQQRLLIELQGMNQRGDTSAQAAQRRGEIVNQFNLLAQENLEMRQASVAQLKAMESAGTTNPARHREWAEGSGEAIAASRLTLQGLSAASINSRINALKGAVEEVQAASAVAKAEAQAVAKARVDNNFYAEGASSTPAGLNTSAGVIAANPHKTTTVLGRWSPDMKNVIGDDAGSVAGQLNPGSALAKTEDFGAKPGGFNVLNVPKSVEDAAGSQFFEKVNKPFLEEAIKRGDDIALGTIGGVKHQVQHRFIELRSWVD